MLQLYSLLLTYFHIDATRFESCKIRKDLGHIRLYDLVSFSPFLNLSCQYLGILDGIYSQSAVTPHSLRSRRFEYVSGAFQWMSIVVNDCSLVMPILKLPP